MDTNKMLQDEAAELQMWQQVAQLAQSGDANALPQIMQIAQQAIQSEEAEMKEMQGSSGQAPDGEKAPFRERLAQAMALKENGGGNQNA